jgi:hypothetical protein
MIAHVSRYATHELEFKDYSLGVAHQKEWNCRERILHSKPLTIIVSTAGRNHFEVYT